MQLTYSLSHDDFLVHQPYIASSSESIKKKRRNNYWGLPICYLALSIILISFRGFDFVSLAFLILIILWLIFYPTYSRKRYRKHYSKYIKENYEKRIGKEIQLHINQEYIESKDENSEGKVKIQAVEQVVELSKHYLIRLEKAASIILPKEVVAEPSAFLDFFKNKNIEYTDQTHWEWK